jgi:hypothetical protein
MYSQPGNALHRIVAHGLWVFYESFVQPHKNDLVAANAATLSIASSNIFHHVTSTMVYAEMGCE